jgi:hypothetical protein
MDCSVINVFEIYKVVTHHHKIFNLVTNLSHIHCFCILNLNEVWWIIMDRFIIDFLDLKFGCRITIDFPYLSFGKFVTRSFPWSVAMSPHKFKNWFCTKTPLNENGVWWCLPYTSITKTQVTWSLLRPIPSTRLFFTMVVKPYIMTSKFLMPFKLLFFNLVLQFTFYNQCLSNSNQLV